MLKDKLRYTTVTHIYTHICNYRPDYVLKRLYRTKELERNKTYKKVMTILHGNEEIKRIHVKT